MQLALFAVGAAAAGTTKPKSESKPKTETATSKKATPTTAAAATTTRQSKSVKVKPVPGENRGKRTLYDFGNAGYLYPEVASRRAGYVDSYYPQAGYYNGQQAIGESSGCTCSVL